MPLRPGNTFVIHDSGSFDRFTVEVVSGPVASGMSSILKGKILDLPRDDPRELVAIKVIRTDTPDRKKLGLRELVAASRATHRHIVPFIGACTYEHFYLMVLPFIKKGNMMEYIERELAADRETLIYQVAEAVDFLHRVVGLVHGDLKCENVLISDEEEALLTDFGLSTTVEKSSREDPTSTGIATMCTVRFAAPELLSYSDMLPVGMRRSKTTQMDVFAFGMLIIQAFTGMHPWPSSFSYVAIIRKMGEHDRPALSAHIGLDDFWWRLCRDCRQLDPRERPSMKTIHSKISKMLDDEEREDPIATWLNSAGLSVGDVIHVDQFTCDEQLSIKLVSEVVARGGSARVLKGKILSSGANTESTLVAVKIIPIFLFNDTTGRELRVVKGLRHRYILPFLGAASTRDYHVLVSPFMENGTMLEYIQTKPAVRPEPLILQVAIAVDHLHRCVGIVHGDLKCNVLISGDGHAQLADFGLATTITIRNPLEENATIENHRAKSTAFAAPELFDGNESLKTPQTDVFAFGMLVLQAFTKSHPWPGIATADVRSRIINKHTPPRPIDSEEIGLTEAWWKLCESCWSSTPDLRPSMESVQNEIHSILRISPLSGCIGRCIIDAIGWKPQTAVQHKVQLQPGEDSDSEVELLEPLPPAKSVRKVAGHRKMEKQQTKDESDELVEQLYATIASLERQAGIQPPKQFKPLSFVINTRQVQEPIVAQESPLQKLHALASARVPPAGFAPKAAAPIEVLDVAPKEAEIAMLQARLYDLTSGGSVAPGAGFRVFHPEMFMPATQSAAATAAPVSRVQTGSKRQHEDDIQPGRSTTLGNGLMRCDDVVHKKLRFEHGGQQLHAQDDVL